MTIHPSAWLPQASYPCGNFSDTSSQKLSETKAVLSPSFVYHPYIIPSSKRNTCYKVRISPRTYYIYMSEIEERISKSKSKSGNRKSKSENHKSKNEK